MSTRVLMRVTSISAHCNAQGDVTHRLVRLAPLDAPASPHGGYRLPPGYGLADVAPHPGPTDLLLTAEQTRGMETGACFALTMEPASADDVARHLVEAEEARKRAAEAEEQERRARDARMAKEYAAQTAREFMRAAREDNGGGE